MNYRPTCAVCGRGVEPDSDRVVAQVEWKRRNDRDELDDYHLHERCARNVLDGWEQP